MPAQCHLGPAGREEDVACALDLPQQLEARPDEPPRVQLAQRMIEVRHRFEHPRLTPPVIHLAEALERLFALGGVG